MMRLRLPLPALLALLSALTLSQPLPAATKAPATYGDVTVSEVTSIYDGDTLRVNIPNWPAIVGSRIPVRVKGIDAPEMRGKCTREITLARQAKQAAVAMVRAGKKIELRNLQRDKYFRLLADVYVDDKSLADTLLKAGLAYAYQGGTKKSWCSAEKPK